VRGFKYCTDPGQNGINLIYTMPGCPKSMALTADLGSSYKTVDCSKESCTWKDVDNPNSQSINLTNLPAVLCNNYDLVVGYCSGK